MKFYRFRSLENFEYTADILLNKRLFASDFRKLNDPMEGAFKLLPDIDKKLSDAIIEAKSDLRICSLSTSMSNPLMWAHYANDFKGICVEIEIDENKLKKVTYVNNILSATENLIDNYYWAERILTTKFRQWEYEKEYRFLTNDEYIENINITAIYFGIRISENYKKILKKIVCNKVSFYDTKINQSNQVIKKD